MNDPLLYIYLIVLCVIFFWFYRDYRVDLYRQHLFALRDQLFDLADSGKVSFNHPAYGMLRNMLNGALQFGHRCGFLDFAIVYFVFLGKSNRQDVNRYADHWQQSCNELTPELSEQLKRIRLRMHVIMFDQAVFTSPVLMFTLLAMLFAIFGWLCHRQFMNWMERIASVRFFSRMMYKSDTFCSTHS